MAERLDSYLIGPRRLNLKKYYQFFESELFKHSGLTLDKYPLNYRHRNYEFWRIRPINPEIYSKWLLLRALIHGNEIWGGAFLLSYFNKLVAYAAKNGVALDIEPCGNPYGADVGLRYNPEDDGKEYGNNDFIRYLKKDGVIVDDLGEEREFQTWGWADEQPLETQLEQGLLKERNRKGVFRQRIAVLDLHGHLITDPWDPKIATSYQYAYEPSSRYKEIISQADKVIPIWRNKRITAGLDGSSVTDEAGVVYRDDGSWTAATFLLGAKDSLAVEVSEKTSLEEAASVYWVWAKGLVDLLD